MAEHLFGKLQIGAHQEGRPVDRVEPDNVLADQVQVRRPVFRKVTALIWKTKPGQIVGQRIDPDIHHVVIAAWNLDPPIKAGSRNRQIAQARFDECDHLVPAALRAQKPRGFEQCKQLVLIGREPEEPAFLNRPFDRGALRREFFAPLTRRDQLALVVIGFVTNRIPAFVAIGIEIALGLHQPPQFLTGQVMARLGGALKHVVRNIQSIAHIHEILRHFGGQLSRRYTQFAGLLGHLEAMLVGPGLEPHVFTQLPLEPRDHVGGNRLIGVADVRASVRIGDRGGDIEWFGHGRALSFGFRDQAASLGMASEASKAPISSAAIAGSKL